MLRRFLVTLIRRSLFILLLVCLGCVAQSTPSDVSRKIEHQMRSFYSIPPEVKITVGAITPASDMAGYDTVAVNIDGDIYSPKIYDGPAARTFRNENDRFLSNRENVEVYSSNSLFQNAQTSASGLIGGAIVTAKIAEPAPAEQMDNPAFTA